MKKYTRFLFSPDNGDASGSVGNGDGGAEGGNNGNSANGGDQPSFVAPDGSFVQGWTDKLPEDMGDSRASFGKFKTVADLTKSYHNLEQKLGKNATAVMVPGSDAKPEEIAAYRKAVGALSTVEEYAAIKPENLPEGVDWNDELAKPVYELAHKYNIPAPAVKEYLNMRIQQEGARVEAINGMIDKQIKEGEEILKREWGSNYGANIKRVEQAARMVSVDPTTAPGFRDPETVKAFLRLSTKIGDDTWRTGTESTNSAGMSAKDIMTNKSNPLYQRYQDGDPAVVEQVRGLLKQGR